jgi:hypothetical protein
VQPVDVERALRRATHLRRRAARRPIGSNGRRKDLAAAAALEREARRLQVLQLNTSAARARDLWLPG